MKTHLFVFLCLTSFGAAAESLKLEKFDQEKLAELLGRLPTTVRTKTVTEIDTPTKGLLVQSVFPKGDDIGFKADCKSKYFNGSPYPSSSTCTLVVDEQHPELDTKYDEWKIELNDGAIAQALFENISYGKPEKDFRSFGKDKGLSFVGKQTYIFHYRMKCSEKACVFNFSKIIGRDNPDLINKQRVIGESLTRR